MNTIIEIGVNNAIGAGVLAVLAALIGLLARKPPLVHAVWLLVLLKLVTPPLVPLAVLPADAVEGAPDVGVALAGAADFAEVDRVPLRTAERNDAALDEWREIEAFGGGLWAGGAGDVERAEGAEPAGVDVVGTKAPARPAATARVDWFGLGVGVWLAGSLLMLAFTAARVVGMARVYRRARPARGAIVAEVAQLSSELGLRRKPRVCEEAGRFSPFVWSLWRWSLLVVPTALWEQLDQEQRTALLLHELAHLKRRDPWVRWVEVLAAVLYWWHPALWLARRQLRAAEERCCDAWVVWARPEAARSYASALVDALEFVSEVRPRRRVAPFGASGLGQMQSIRGRITMIMERNTQRRLSWVGMLVVGGLAACLPCLPTRAAPQDAPATPTTNAAIGLLLRGAEAGAEGERARVSGDSDDLTGAVELARSQVRIKEAQLKKAIAGREGALAEMIRVDRLRTRPGLVSEYEASAVNARLRSAEADVEIARAELDEAKVRLSLAERKTEGTLGARTPNAGLNLNAATADEAQARMEAMNKLKQIGLAAHQYADAHERFPGYAIRGKDGKPLLSWRVALLPYLGQEELYRRFRLDEPWNSQHNIQLLPEMPDVYGTGERDFKTNIRGVGMRGSVLDPERNEGLKLTEITDGTSTTVFAVRQAHPVIWTAPEDANAPFALDRNALALYCDGSVRTLPNDGKVLSAVMSAAGGEVIDPSALSSQAEPVIPRNQDEYRAMLNARLSGRNEAELAAVKEMIARAQAEGKADLIHRYLNLQGATEPGNDQVIGLLNRFGALPGGGSSLDGAARAERMNNMKQIGLALHNFHEVNGRLPGAAIYGEDGTPLLSWRVAILPFLDQTALYQEFHLNEPWDSEHNKRLIAKMPKIFGDSKDGKTGIAGFGTPGSVFDPARKKGLAISEIHDGLSNTIAAAEGNAVVWTQPDELAGAPSWPNPLMVLFCDGAVRMIAPRNQGVLNALLSVSGGEALEPGSYEPAQDPARPADSTTVIEIPLVQQINERFAAEALHRYERHAAESARSLDEANRRIAELEGMVKRLRDELEAARVGK